MNNKDYISELAERTGYSPEETQRMVNIVIEAMGDHFQEDDSVLVPNFRQNWYLTSNRIPAGKNV